MSPLPPPVARSFGPVNWRGVATLYGRATRRGLRLWPVSLVAPGMRAAMLAGVFSLIVAERSGIGHPGFIAFLLPGLIAAAILERAFEAGANALVYDKLEGIINDIVGAPLTPLEMTLAMAAAAASDGLLAGLAVSLVLLPFGLTLPAAPFWFLFFAVSGAAMVAFFAIIAGIWARKWDQISAIQTFLFIPFVFLSGVFFPPERLPAAGQDWIHANPVFHVVNGLRTSLYGWNDASPLAGAATVLAMACIFGTIAWSLIRSGYRIKT